MTPARKRCPLYHSAAAFALAGACCRSGCVPAAEAWTACPGGVIGRPAAPPHLPPPTTSHRARCRPRREWGSLGTFGMACEAEGRGIVAPRSVLFRRECACAPRSTEGGPRGRARRQLLWSQKSEMQAEAHVGATMEQPRRRRFWRTFVTGLLAATALAWLSPRVAAAVSAVATSASEEVVGAAVTETVSTVASAAATETAAAAAAAVSVAAEVSPLVRPLGSLQVLPTRAEMELSLRLFFAALGGAAVGLERSSSDRPAGVRTMALVSLGAAAFTLCSMYGFMSVGALVGPNGPTTKYDPSRMASNVASGVGFIGAGVITNNRKAAGVYDRQSTVGGLTTAAAIWTSAAIGVANGVGLYFIGASAAVSTILILRFGHLKHGHLWDDGRDVTVGSKKKKKAESLSAMALDSAGLVNSTLITAEGTNMTAALEPSASFAGGDIAKPKHGSVIDARLEELSSRKDAGEVIPSGSTGSSVKPQKQFDAEERMRADYNSVKIEKVDGPDADQEADTILEIKSAPKERTKEENLTSIDSPMPPPSTADPLLEKYLWGVDSSKAENDEEIGSNGKSSHQRHSIEEEQQVVFRDGRMGEKPKGTGKEGCP